MCSFVISLQFKFSCLPESLVQQRDLQQTLLITILPPFPRQILPQACVQPENERHLLDEARRWKNRSIRHTHPLQLGEPRDNGFRLPLSLLQHRLLLAVALVETRQCPSPGKCDFFFFFFEVLFSKTGLYSDSDIVHFSPSSRPFEELSRTPASSPPSRRKASKNRKNTQGEFPTHVAKSLYFHTVADMNLPGSDMSSFHSPITTPAETEKATCQDRSQSIAKRTRRGSSGARA